MVPAIAIEKVYASLNDIHFATIVKPPGIIFTATSKPGCNIGGKPILLLKIAIAKVLAFFRLSNFNPGWR